MCSGPFKFESWTEDQIVLAANDQYWAGRPQIDRVVFRFIADGKAVVEALLKGEVDFVARLPDPSGLERLRESPASSRSRSRASTSITSASIPSGRH